MTGYRPLPQPSPLTAPFWDGARRGELWVQRCSRCTQHVFYPRYVCPACGSLDIDWVQVSGLATVFTYTVARRATHPAFAGDVPYVIAIVELDEGPKMTTNVVGIAPDDVTIGLRVEATYHRLGDVTLVHFRPVR